MITDTETKYYFSLAAIITALIPLTAFIFLLVFTANQFLLSELKYALLFGIFFCIIFFILFFEATPKLYKYICCYLKKIPALILTENELIDNINNQKYKWTDIDKIISESVQMKWKIKFIAISVSEPYKYIGSIQNPYIRFIARINQKKFNRAFSIQPNIIRCNNAELLENLIQHHTKATRINSPEG